MRKTVLLPAAAPRCASGANCVAYPTLGEPSKLSRGNPGQRCFACEKQRGEREVGVFAAKLKAAKHRQVKSPSCSKDYDPNVRSEAERFSERPITERAGAAAVGHQHPEVSHASAIRERRRASVLTCERGGCGLPLSRATYASRAGGRDRSETRRPDCSGPKRMLRRPRRERSRSRDGREHAQRRPGL